MFAGISLRILVGCVCVLGLLSPSRAATRQCDPASFKIAIDVGHTPEATGALSARGTTEYDFNTHLVEVITSTLVKAGFGHTTNINVHGTGRDQLAKRTDDANRQLPNLLLSIHHDDTQKTFHSKWIVAGVSRDYSDYATGFSIFVSSKNAQFPESLKFAKLLGAAFRDQGMAFSPHHAADIAGERKQLIDASLGVYLYDDLYVLRHSLAPAVLLEAGVITNREDELRLGSNEGRHKIADNILHAINAVCEAK